MKEPFSHFVEPSEFIRANLCFSDGMGIECQGGFLIDRGYFDNYLVMYVEEGVLFHEQNGRKLRIVQGEYVFADLKFPHKYYFEQGVPSKIYWSHLNGGVVEEVAKRVNALCPLPFQARSSQMRDRLVDCFSFVQQGGPEEFPLSQMLYGIMLTVLQNCREAQYQKGKLGELEEFDQKAEEAIQRHIYRPADLESLAAFVNMSKYHFCRLYHSRFGVSPVKRLMQEKIRTAQLHLLYTNDKVESIGEQLAFSSLSYFSKVFKAQTGLSPAKYREIMRHRQDE